jgi:hypothetical protein
MEGDDVSSQGSGTLLDWLASNPSILCHKILLPSIQQIIPGLSMKHTTSAPSFFLNISGLALCVVASCHL